MRDPSYLYFLVLACERPANKKKIALKTQNKRNLRMY